MYLRRILCMVVAMALLGAAALSAGQPDQKGPAENRHTDRDFDAYGSYVPAWPLPEGAELPSHYPPYHRNTN